MRKSICVIFVLFLLAISSLDVEANVTTSIAEEKNHLSFSLTKQKYNNNLLEINESHIIDNPRIPYVSQETGFYCRFASLTMIIKYYVENATLNDILFNSGIGYTLAYFRPLKIHPLPGIMICQWEDFSGEFIAPLYGLSYERWTAKNQEDKWHQYWPKLKEKINQDTPILTDVDPFALPWYKDHINTSNETHDSHSIVIVGYNESANIVYYNDPGPTVGGESENNCSYVPLSLDDFRDGLKNNTIQITSYMLENFEKNTNPKSKEEIFNISHERNIQRLKGNYSEPIFNIIPLTDYGLKAVKSIRKDAGIGLKHRFSTLLLMKFFNIMNYTIPIGPSKGDLQASQIIKIIAIEKQNMSKYLLENQDSSLLCIMEGELLAKEASHWYNLSELDNELFKACSEGPIKSWFRSISIFNQIKKELDEIICIEEEIIKGFAQ